MGESLPKVSARPSDFRGIGLCIACDYPLRGLPANRCPECGREFDPSDPGSMNLGRPLGSRRRWLLKQPVWPVMLATVAMALLHLWLARFPGGMGSEPKTWAAWGWVGVLGIWFVQVFARHWIIINLDPHTSLRAARPWRWRAVPAIAVATCIVASTQAPFRLAMLISRPWMNAMAREIRSNPPRLDYPPRWVGVFRAENIYTTTDEVGFTVTHPAGGYDVLFAQGAQWRWEWISRGNAPGLRQRVQHELATSLEKKADWSPHVLAIMIETLANDDESHYPWAGHTKLAGGWRQGGREPHRAFDRFSGGRGPLRPDMRALLRAGSSALPALRQALISHKDPAVRMRVASVLSLMGEDAAPAIPELTLALSDPESLVRETAALALGMIGPQARPAAPALAMALCDVDPWVQYNATLALRWIKPDPRTYVAAIQDGLSARLGLPVATTRPALGRGTLMQPRLWPPAPWQNAPWMKELLGLAADVGPAAGGLGEVLGATLLAPVPQPPVNVGASRDVPSYEYPIQLAVLEAIAAIGPDAKDALPALLKVLEDDGATWASNTDGPSDRPHLRPEFATALARAIAAVEPHSPKAAAILAQRIELMWPPGGPSTAPVRRPAITREQGEQAASMLAVIDPGNSRAIDALLAYLPGVAPRIVAMVGAGDERVIRKATELVARGDFAGLGVFAEMAGKASAARPALVVLLDRPEPKVRQAAALSLAAIGANDEALPVLIEMLDGADGRAAREAAEALGKMGPAAKAAVPHLRTNLRREEGGGSSAVALGQISTPEAAAALIEFLADPPKNSTASVANYAMSRLGPAAGDAAAQALAKLAQSKDGAYYAPALARVAPASKDPASLLSLALHTGSNNPEDQPAMAQAMRDFARCASFEQLLAEARYKLRPDRYATGELLKATGEALAPYADEPRVRELMMDLYLDAESDAVRQLARNVLHHPTQR